MKEEAFRQQVCRIAREFGYRHQYHTYDSRRSNPGWPDNVFANEETGHMFFVEFKSEKGRLTQPQKKWIEVLAKCGQDVIVWRPSDLPNILSYLRARAAMHQVKRKNPPLIDVAIDEPEPSWMFRSELKETK